LSFRAAASRDCQYHRLTLVDSINLWFGMQKEEEESSVMSVSTKVSICLMAVSMLLSVGCGQKEPPDMDQSPTRNVSVPVAPSQPFAAGVRPATPEEISMVPDGTQLYSPDSGKPTIKNANTPALVCKGRRHSN